MRYRKKPIEIEAFQMTEERMESREDWPNWLILAWEKKELQCIGSGALHIEWRVRTLEGSLHISANDWIIRGVKGELYPCKPDIFEATYVAVNELDYPEGVS